MSKLAEILKRRRKELNLSPEHISKEIGMSKRAYLYYEDGRDPKHDVLQKLAKVLQFNASEIYEEKQESDKSDENKSEINPASGTEMNAMFLTLIKHLKEISDYLKGIKGDIEGVKGDTEHIGVNLNSTKYSTDQNTSLLQAVLLRQATYIAPTEAEVDGLFQESLQVARNFLKEKYKRIGKDTDGRAYS